MGCLQYLLSSAQENEKYATATQEFIVNFFKFDHAQTEEARNQAVVGFYLLLFYLEKNNFNPPSQSLYIANHSLAERIPVIQTTWPQLALSDDQNNTANLLLEIRTGLYFHQFTLEQIEMWLTSVIETVTAQNPAEPARLSTQYKQLIERFIDQISTEDKRITEQQAAGLKALLK